MSSDAFPDVSALAINVTIPEGLRWTDTTAPAVVRLARFPDVDNPALAQRLEPFLPAE